MSPGRGPEGPDAERLDARRAALPRDLACGLYAIVDVRSVLGRGLDPLAFARAVLEARPAALQIRAKELPSRELLELLRGAGALCRAAAVPLVANDRVDLAIEAGCDYVHVGQEDLSVEHVRHVAPALRVGVSTHTPEQLSAALRAAPDYVAYGPVYATTSKIDPDPCVGLEGLEVAGALAREARTPLVAIGGVTLERAAEIGRWAHAAAVIGALLPTASPPSGARSAYDEVSARAVAIHAALGGRSDERVARA